MASTATWKSQVSFSERVRLTLKMQVRVLALCHLKHANIDLRPAPIS